MLPGYPEPVSYTQPFGTTVIGVGFPGVPPALLAAAVLAVPSLARDKKDLAALGGTTANYIEVTTESLHQSDCR